MSHGLHVFHHINSDQHQHEIWVILLASMYVITKSKQELNALLLWMMNEVSKEHSIVKYVSQ